MGGVLSQFGSMLVTKVHTLIFHILHIDSSYQSKGFFFFQNKARTKFILNEVSDFRNSSHYTNDYCVFIMSFHSRLVIIY